MWHGRHTVACKEGLGVEQRNCLTLCRGVEGEPRER